MLRRLVVLAGLGAALVPPAVAAEEAFRVPLSVQESAGVARRSEPISGGVPLPRGRFRANQAFAVARADGSPLPCQVVPLVVETDGTLRWVLVDFQDDVAAGATALYTLTAGRPAAPPPAPALKVQEGPAGVTVDTGRIRFTVARNKPFGLFSAVDVDGRSVVTGGAVRYVQMQGRRGWNDPAPWAARELAAGPPETLQAWYAGPMRITIEACGRFADDPLRAGYRAWITAWAGSGRAHVKYSLANSNPDRYTAVLVGRSAVELAIPGPEGVILGAAEPIEAGAEGWLHHGLRLERSGPGAAAVRVGAGPRELWASTGPKDVPAGWLLARGPNVLACDVLFAGNPARRLAAGGGRLVLEGVAGRFPAPPDEKGRRALPWTAAGFWLYDCSHHTSEYVFDFDPPADPEAPGRLARAARNRLWARAPGEWVGRTEALASGRFGTLDDEKACYAKWGWTWKPAQEPHAEKPVPGAFVGWEDNHYESEADSVQALVLQYLRTGQRGWFDLAEAWARYHMDLQAWRTDGWRWRDGAIWFPQGGPQGNRRTRADWNFAWGPDWGERQASPDCADLWRHSQAKSCYCHFYGSGLADWFCLTGDRDALEAALDNVETKDEEFRRSKQYVPGKTPIGEIRGFGRGFEVLMRVLEVDPGNTFVADLAHLAARTLRASPLLDERGFHAAGGGVPVKELTPKIRQWMADRGITFTPKGDKVETLSKGGVTWPVRAFSGTWQHVYVQNGADLYARHFDDEDLRDFAVGFGEMTARYLLSPKCHQTWYYTYFDVPDFGMVFDPWAIEHTATTDGEGCVHSGWYTRFFPDACALGYAWTGEARLLERGREFWYYGSKREYQTKGLRGGPNEVNLFAGHHPPKDDQVLSAARLFYHAAHPRADAEPPAAVRDLAVRLLGDGRAEVRFTAPADTGGGRAARYQVKVAPLPLAAAEDWVPARDAGRKRNWWLAANCRAEPAPSVPGTPERFVVTGVPAEGGTLYFAVRTFDDSGNRSAVSNAAMP